MSVDPIQAKRFIELLTGDANAVVTFQTFDDSQKKRGHLTDTESHAQHHGSSCHRRARQ